MRKKFISILLVVCMVVTMMPIQALAESSASQTGNITQQTNPFNDVTDEDWFYSDVMNALSENIFGGSSSTTFSPYDNMTRAMYVTVLGRVAGISTDSYGGNGGFADVVAGEYYAPYVNWAVQKNITNGVGDKKFDPDGLITREQMAALTVRFFDAYEITFPADKVNTTPADFSSISDWAKNDVMKLWKCELLKGDNKGSINPLNNTSRAEGAAFFGRINTIVKEWQKDEGTKTETYTVSFMDGKTLMAKESVQAGKTLSKTPSTAKSGYTFVGWYTNEALTTAFNKNTPITADMTVYAKYTAASTGGGGGGGGGGGSITSSYNVTFAMGIGEDATGVTLPEKKLYKAGAALTDLPKPEKQNLAFLGWYYDANLTMPVKNTDTISRNMTLYAKTTELTGVAELENVSFARIDVSQSEAKGFSFKVNAVNESSLRSALSIIDVSGGNAEIEYTLSGSAGAFTVTPLGIAGNGANKSGLEQGRTYKISLDEEADAYFAGQEQSVRTLTVITAKADVQKLELNDGIKYIKKSEIKGDEPLEGLFKASLDSTGGVSEISQVEKKGTFKYEGTALSVGDIVSIYEGIKPSERTQDTANEYVAYVEITAVNGSSYSYKTADSEDVMFTPDVLPLDSSKDKIAGDGKKYTADRSDLDFSDDMYAVTGLSSQTTVDVGDFIALYSGNLQGASGAQYALITDVSWVGDVCTITYEDASAEDVLASMDIHQSEKEQAIELSEKQQQDIEDAIVTQAMDSGFVDEAANYLTALALETDGFQKLADDSDFKLSGYSITSSDGTELEPGQVQLMAGSKPKVTKSATAKLSWGKDNMEHFSDRNGVRVELSLVIKITMGKIEINVTAVFEQEVILGLTTDGGAVWKWWGIIPYIADYKMTAAFTAGTYTGVGITATCSTKDDDDEEAFDWKPVTGNKAEKKILDIGKQIKELMDEKDKFFGKTYNAGDDADDDAISVGGGLADKYSDMMENADETWIDLVRKEIFSNEGFVDPFHILAYGVSADFVIQANVYVTLGMTFTFAAAKEYVFTVKLFDRSCTNGEVDLEKPNYNFDFYVMGTLGIRMGVEFEIGIGLFSLRLDSIGFTAEAGVYAQLWGYFYYSLSWTQGGEKESSYSGAMAIEVGAYIVLKFKASLLGSDKLTYSPTLYEKSIPFYTVGEVYNVNAFADCQETSFMLIDNLPLTMPGDVFDMVGLNLKTGNIGDGEDEDGHEAPRNYDDATESRYTITFDNEHFHYNPATNQVTFDAVNDPNRKDSVVETKMTLLWKYGTLEFGSEPITRTLDVMWMSNPENMRYYNFDSMGGSYCRVIRGEYGQPYTKMAVDPTRTGYTFGGWYKTPACDGAQYSFPDTMPNFGTPEVADSNGTEKGITLYARWIPNTDTKYAVDYYVQKLDGSYEQLTENTSGTVDENGEYVEAPAGSITLAQVDATLGKYSNATTAEPAKTWYNKTAKYTTPDGFSYNARRSTDQGASRIAPNGSTVLEVYFDRNTHTATYSFGDSDTITNTLKYGASVSEPRIAKEGYTFEGWNQKVPDTMPDNDITFTAKWSANTDTPYRVEKYVQDSTFGSEKYFFDSAVNCVGTTDAALELPEGYEAPVKMTVNGLEKSLSDITVAANGKLVVKCYYDRDIYTVNFDTNDGIPGAIEGQTVRQGGKIAEPETDPSKTGFAFAGWYDGETKWDFATMTAEKTLTLTAKWVNQTDITYKVEHYKQNLDNDEYVLADTDTLQGTTGSTVDLIAKNYTGFHGKAGNAATITIDPDGTAFAKLYYDRDVCIVTFDSGGGSEVAPQSIRYGGKIVEPEDPANTGCYFDGWYKSPGNMQGKADFDAVITDTAPVTYYAVWKKAGFDFIILNKDQDGNLLSKVTDIKQYQASIDMNHYKEAYTDEGKSFKSFDIPAALNAVDGVFTMPDEAVTVTIIWDAARYTVHFDPNGGTGTMADIPARYGGEITLTTNAFTLADHTFTGWNTAADGSGTAYAEGATGKDLTKIDGATVTLYAQWKNTTGVYTITYNGLDGITNTTDFFTTYNGQSEIVLGTPNRSGYTFTGWSGTDLTGESNMSVTIAKGSTGNRTYTAHWVQLGSYTVNLDCNGGTFGTDKKEMVTITRPTDETVEITNIIPVKTSYRFTGWYTAKEGGTKVDTVTSADAGKTLYAGWTDNTQVWLTFDLNGGYYQTGRDHYVFYGQTYGSSGSLGTANHETAGMTFVGWFTAADGGTQVTDDTTVTSTQNHTLYAHWRDDRTYYTVTFYDSDNTTVLHTEKVLSGGTVSRYNAEKAGYSLSWWEDTAHKTWNFNFSDNSAQKEPTQIKKDKNFYAKWTANSYKYTIKNYDPTKPDSVKTGTDETDSIVTLKTYAEKAYAGWKFVEWQLSRDGVEGIEKTFGNQNLKMRSYDCTVTAVWQEQCVNIDYQLGGGSFSTTVETKYQSASSEQPLTIPDPTRDGYIFMGWTVGDPDGKIMKITTFGGTVTGYSLLANAVGTVTMTANWVEDYSIQLLDNETDELLRTYSPTELYTKRSGDYYYAVYNEKNGNVNVDWEPYHNTGDTMTGVFVAQDERLKAMADANHVVKLYATAIGFNGDAAAIGSVDDLKTVFNYYKKGGKIDAWIRANLTLPDDLPADVVLPEGCTFWTDTGSYAPYEIRYTITYNNATHPIFSEVKGVVRTTNIVVNGGVYSGEDTKYGSAAGVIAAVNSGSITSCIVSGTIKGATAAGEFEGLYYLGGIAGINAGKISSCTVGTADNTTTIENAIHLGGIAGMSMNSAGSRLNKCTVTDTVTLTGSTITQQLGGIAGTLSGEFTSSSTPMLGSTCSANIHQYVDPEGSIVIGGLVGRMDTADFGTDLSVNVLETSTFAGSLAVGQQSGQSDWKNDGVVSIGGIVGSIGGRTSEQANFIEVNTCSLNGAKFDITETNRSTYLGGNIGQVEDGTIANAKSNTYGGTISVKAAENHINYQLYKGYIAGRVGIGSILNVTGTSSTEAFGENTIGKKEE